MRERLRGVLATRRYTNPRLPYLTLPYRVENVENALMESAKVTPIDGKLSTQKSDCLCVWTAMRLSVSWKFSAFCAFYDRSERLTGPKVWRSVKALFSHLYQFHHLTGTHRTVDETMKQQKTKTGNKKKLRAISIMFLLVVFWVFLTLKIISDIFHSILRK